MMRLRAANLFCCAALLTAGLFLLPALLEAKDAREVELRFDGRPKVGETYVIAVNSRQVRTYRMKLVGISNPPRRRETHEIHAVGELVYQSLDPLVIQFKVEMLSQIVDGVKTDYAPLAGMTAIVRSSGVNLRDIPLGTEENAAASVLGGGDPGDASGAKTKEEIRAMLPGARRLIASMFSVPLDHPEEYLGKTRKVKPGGKWTASARPMLEAIKANGLELFEEKVTATATYNNPFSFEGVVPAQRVYFLAESDNIPGYDFKLEVFFVFPDGGGDAPLQVERSATEVVNRAIPEGVPGFSGSMMDCVTTDQSEIRMVRKSLLKAKKKNWFLDLFD